MYQPAMNRGRRPGSDDKGRVKGQDNTFAKAGHLCSPMVEMGMQTEPVQVHLPVTAQGSWF